MLWLIAKKKKFHGPTKKKKRKKLRFVHEIKKNNYNSVERGTPSGSPNSDRNFIECYRMPK